MTDAPVWTAGVPPIGSTVRFSLEGLRRSVEYVKAAPAVPRYVGPILSTRRFHLCSAGNHVPLYGICAYCWEPATRYGTAYTEMYRTRGPLATPKGRLP